MGRVLNIGGHKIRVVEKDLDDFYGEFDFETNTIFIHKHMSQGQKDSTLLHEIFHVLLPTVGDTEFGHAWIDSLSQQLYQVFRDNIMDMRKKEKIVKAVKKASKKNVVTKKARPLKIVKVKKVKIL